ncbi:MAG: TonB-dependent receptor [Ignavibacteriaceae bacterium]
MLRVVIPTFLTSFGDTLPNTEIDNEDSFYKSSAYLNFNTTFFGRLSANLGVRGDYFNPIEKKFYISPRFSVSYRFTDLTSINFSTGIYYQAPSYIWLIAEELNKNLNSIRADQFILGVEHYLREDLLLRVEAFVKNYKDYPTSLLRPYLILANTGAGYAGSDDNFSSFGLEPLVSRGKGEAKGIEVSAQKKLSGIPVYGIFSFTYSNADFIPLDGIKRPGVYEQEWIFNLSGGYKINESWEAAVKFRYASGNPFTPFNSDGTQSVINYYTQRLKAKHSLDLRVDKRWFFDDLTLITYIDLQNIYGNKASSFIRWDPREQKVDEESSIGLLPSIGVSLEF